MIYPQCTTLKPVENLCVPEYAYNSLYFDRITFTGRYSFVLTIRFYAGLLTVSGKRIDVVFQNPSHEKAVCSSCRYQVVDYRMKPDATKAFGARPKFRRRGDWYVSICSECSTVPLCIQRQTFIAADPERRLCNALRWICLTPPLCVA